LSLKYINRKGKTYFLHEGKTKKGNSRYFFSQSENFALNEIPKGYQIYENPNAQVFLRRIQPKLINKVEEALVKEVLKELIERKYCRITVEKSDITIYWADHNVERMRDIWINTPRAQKEGIEVLIDQEITYSPVIILTLQAPKERLFILKMPDFEGVNMPWKVVGNPVSLETLISNVMDKIDIETYYSSLF